MNTDLLKTSKKISFVDNFLKTSTNIYFKSIS